MKLIDDLNYPLHLDIENKLDRFFARFPSLLLVVDRIETMNLDKIDIDISQFLLLTIKEKEMKISQREREFCFTSNKISRSMEYFNGSNFNASFR